MPTYTRTDVVRSAMKVAANGDVELDMGIGTFMWAGDAGGSKALADFLSLHKATLVEVVSDDTMVIELHILIDEHDEAHNMDLIRRLHNMLG